MSSTWWAEPPPANKTKQKQRQCERLNLLLFFSTFLLTVRHPGSKTKRRVSLWGTGQLLREVGGVPHRRISLEGTHHLCTFVELSHFNPPPQPSSPFGNPHRTPPHTHTNTPHSVMSALPPLCCCSPVSGFHQSHPDNCLTSVRNQQVGRSRRTFDVLQLFNEEKCLKMTI